MNYIARGAGRAVFSATLLLALTTAAPASMDQDPGAEYQGHKHYDSQFTVCKRHCRYDKIQRAVDAAKPGAVILIGPGTFFENIVVNKHSVSLVGVSAEETTVDGGFRGPVFVLGPQNSGAGPGQISVTLTGMTITHGHGVNGGGIEQNVSSLQLADCIITSNVATQSGGGIVVWTASPGPTPLATSIENCAIVHNQAPLGAGIEVEVEGGLQITNSLIAANSGGDGAGLHGEYASYTTIATTTISNNISSGSGGGVWIASPIHVVGVPRGVVVLDSSAVVNNTATVACGGFAMASLTTTCLLSDPGSVIALNLPGP